MLVKFKTLKNAFFELDIEEDMTVQSVKEKISEKFDNID